MHALCVGPESVPGWGREARLPRAGPPATAHWREARAPRARPYRPHAGESTSRVHTELADAVPRAGSQETVGKLRPGETGTGPGP